MYCRFADLDINVLNSRESNASCTQDALSVVSDATENGSSTLLSDNTGMKSLIYALIKFEMFSVFYCYYYYLKIVQN